MFFACFVCFVCFVFVCFVCFCVFPFLDDRRGRYLAMAVIGVPNLFLKLKKRVPEDAVAFVPHTGLYNSTVSTI